MKSKLERLMEPRLEAAATTLGWSIRRQVRVGRYVLDFLVETDSGHALIVELDGAEWHERNEDQGLKDRQRDRFLLRSFGVPTIRFLGKEILSNPDAIVTGIIQVAARLGQKARIPA